MWDKVWNGVITPVLQSTFDWINQFFTAIPEFKGLIISFFVICAICRFILFPLLGISNSIFRQEVTSSIRESIKNGKSNKQANQAKKAATATAKKG